MHALHSKLPTQTTAPLIAPQDRAALWEKFPGLCAWETAEQRRSCRASGLAAEVRKWRERLGDNPTLAEIARAADLAERESGREGGQS